MARPLLFMDVGCSEQRWKQRLTMICDSALAVLGRTCCDILKCLVIVTTLSTFTFSGLSADPALEPQHDEPNHDISGESIGENSNLPDSDPLNTLMQSIVSIEVKALDDARTAETFGVTRTGTGVVIDTAGLVVTAGDIVAEAETITITFRSGEVSSASLVAYDHRTGLGLVRAETSVPTVAIEIGNSAGVNVDDLGMIIPSGGEMDAVAVTVGKIDVYSGGWEYIIRNALHTYPPSTNFSGAALVSDSAKLLGIGTLVSIDIDIDPKIRVPGNVFVPVNALTEVIGKLLVDGRSDSPHRQPWIGLDVKKTKRGIAVSSVTPDGPAENAGIRSGDILVALNRKKIEGQTEFFEKLWQTHKPDDQVEIMVLRGAEYQTLQLIASDYHEWLRKPNTETQLSELAD